ncbi:vanadium-dependent haloperoxidase [Roseisolibacter sp. H3M3-2]|uniref:vanadium-dependent haloperoxidase n=1 Tax=Roseisolibacter sp. H3M3-2 TaxID=3031323 RepID=UPI0023DAAF86|nr:vanadium-dependent haloperoxidase [Roseisolibacter sp. H3M3-2]MDF1504802.1 vanadium-dependent haloperoxidase [Roseisolibacter sp. H3M3-2]
MTGRILPTSRRLLSFLSLALAACADAPTVAVPPAPSTNAVKFWDASASLAWNRTARELIGARSDAGNPTTQARLFTYLSIAQYNAVVAAEEARERGDHPSPAAAVAAASVAVLKSFLPAGTHATLDARLQAQLAAPGWPGERHTDADAGLAVGQAVGAQVVAYAATDGANGTPAPANPGGVGRWTGAGSFLGLYGARTLALTSGDQFRPAPPPAYGSAQYAADLAEVKALSIGITDAQRATVTFWAPNNATWMNALASDLIVSHHRTEREAARILTLANVAGFDVLNACFDAKFAYYYVRPSQADAGVKLALPLPNHPSYPSGHSCITAAYATVLGDVFPDERARLDAMVDEAGMSRVYAGFHFRFDVDAGQVLGRRVAEWVLAHGVDRRAPFALD